ncbi:glycosyltransferase family 4 protein [Anaerobium acetethylicum]|uniref:Glycosyltransferase involved in cell wall bisynthesis n=1 Tax=Anaerobium acetethylicum TaxID=1619234 RepID=A0A1D3TR91_9FIRM|nr:glycosyltransferase family 4 protein [Anaerobium acetethylicum]SCP96228.1 Glycosyltransferase involved in cell wall bisynthesis [Anaerobium acetethylicum]
MSKFLIFMEKSLLKPVGGPAGYLYTLYQEDIKRSNQLNFLTHLGEIEDTSVAVSSSSSVKESIINEFRTIKHVVIGNRSEDIESNEYALIHFHRTSDVYKFRKSLKKYKGVVVLTSHCPTLGSIETYNGKKRWEQILFWPVFKLSEMADKRSFGLADYIVFPCEEAEEPYIHAWNGFEKFKSENSEKFRYLLTGTNKRTAKVSRDEIRSKFNIPLDAKVICYVGRHNEIKGYDKLEEFGIKLLEKYPDAYILVAGKEEPIKGLNHPHWIEVGWTNDPHSLINASDIFVLPNRETYFDLVLLEVLSLGTIPLISHTGGNKYFDKDAYEGIFVYRDDEDFFRNVENIFKLDIKQLDKLRKSNRQLFETEFDVPVFYENNVTMLNECLKK